MTSTADMTQHPDVSEISDLTEGLLPPSRSADLQQHLDGCALCADVHASLEEIRGVLGALPGATRMPADIAERIDAALAAEALLDSTAPDDTTHVSRETSPTVVQRTESEHKSVDRPAGHARGTTGPGRNRPSRRRRRVAFLGAIFTVAALGMSVTMLQLNEPAEKAADSTARSTTPATTGELNEFTEAGLKSQVRTLLTAPHGKLSHGTSFGTKEQNEPRRLRSPASAPPCVQKGTGRSDSPIAFEQGAYQGEPAYLMVFPVLSDDQRVEAYVVDAGCVDAPSSSGKVLLTSSYPRP
ncbi:anti-sigma factor family protein [Streptomyces sp. NPDC020965]|uniref:anti-sigma factor family protein n=1 Tax=Streptomyces sp. NPDC020965 TaxID=3365105 RepID=UPI00378BC570